MDIGRSGGVNSTKAQGNSNQPPITTGTQQVVEGTVSEVREKNGSETTTKILFALNLGN